ncbi:lipoprotein [Cohnella sp. WQ 127256]|uniref:lipoprotein n=1 Tax=Cohnella sp. WQ 127256 TaxID=2938790 RepID=UPI002118D65C|nr:lipoprotein [Cohnella sp. WQ 127256]
MKRIRVWILVALAIFLLSGCNTSTPEIDNPEPYIIVEISKPTSNEMSYQTYKTIKDAAKAIEIKLILKQAAESNVMVSMSRNPDYKITISSIDPTASSEPQIYGIWHSPRSKLVEVVSEGSGGGYIQLNSKDSKIVRAALD